MKSSHKKGAKKSKKDANITKEKRQFDALSEADKMAYLEQAFRAQQIFDCVNYDISGKNRPKIKQGSATSVPGLFVENNGHKIDNAKNLQKTLNRIPENTAQFTTSDRPVNQIQESFAKITLADQGIPIDNHVSSIICAGKIKGGVGEEGSK